MANLTLGGSGYLLGGVKLTGTTLVNGGSLSVEGVGNSVGILSVSGGGDVSFDLSKVSAGSTAYMLSTSTAQNLASGGCISVRASQGAGVYELASGFTIGEGTNFSLVVDGTWQYSLSVGSSYVYSGMKYSLAKSGTKLTLKAVAVTGEMLKGTAVADTLVGKANCDVFYGGTGDDLIQGGGGRDVAIYDTKNWGNDTIEATSGTMSILFNGIKESQVTTSLSGTTMTITRKGVSGQSITIKNWDDSTHSLVFGGTLSKVNTWVNAASPTSAQQTAARDEAWKKTGLLAS